MHLNDFTVSLIEKAPETSVADYFASHSSQGQGIQRSREYLEWITHACHARTWALLYKESVTGIVITHTWNSFGCIGVCEYDVNIPHAATVHLLEVATETLAKECDVIGTHIPEDRLHHIRAFISAGYTCVEPQFTLAISYEYLKNKFSSQNASSASKVIMPCTDVYGSEVFGNALTEKGRGVFSAQRTDDEHLLYSLCIETKPRFTAQKEKYALVSHGILPRYADTQRLERFIYKTVEKELPEANTLLMSLNSVYTRELNQLVAGGWNIVRVTHRCVLENKLSQYRQLMRLPQIDLSNWQL